MNSGPNSGPLVVVGDALLDIDLYGETARVCPATSTPVLEGLTEVTRPAGAGLVAVQAAADGRDVVLITPNPADESGLELLELIERAGVSVIPLRSSGSTSVRCRVRTAGGTLVRLDSGEPGDLGVPSTAAIDAIFDASALLVADHGLGTTSVRQLREALTVVGKTVPFVWAAHHRGAAPVPNVSMAVASAADAASVAGSLGGCLATLAGRDELELARVTEGAAHLVKLWGCRHVAVTMGHRGVLLSNGEETAVVGPVGGADNTDVCGDECRFVSSLATALADGKLPHEAVASSLGHTSRSRFADALPAN